MLFALAARYFGRHAWKGFIKILFWKLVQVKHPA
jgi:hypothetical protein